MLEFIEELADVYICMLQMQINLASAGLMKSFYAMVENKLSRLEKRISERE